MSVKSVNVKVRNSAWSKYLLVVLNVNHHIENLLVVLNVNYNIKNLLVVLNINHHIENLLGVLNVNYHIENVLVVLNVNHHIFTRFENFRLFLVTQRFAQYVSGVLNRNQLRLKLAGMHDSSKRWVSSFCGWGVVTSVNTLFFLRHRYIFCHMTAKILLILNC